MFKYHQHRDCTGLMDIWKTSILTEECNIICIRGHVWYQELNLGESPTRILCV